MRNLIPDTKVDNTFPVIQFCVPGYSVPLRLDITFKCHRQSYRLSFQKILIAGDFNVQVSDIKLDTFCSYGI